MNSADFQVGKLVEHANKPEWGPGKIVKVVPERVYVVWRDLPDREAKAFIHSVVRLAPNQQDSVLDNLPPLVEKNGALILPATRIPFQQALNKFLSLFPQGFYDSKYIGTRTEGERFYVWDAHLYYVQRLSDGQFRKLLENDLPRLILEVERCVSKVNLLYLTEAAAFRDALKDEAAARLFLIKLADLLEAESITENVFESFANAVCNLPAKRGRVATWPVATIIPFLAQPDRHMFLKPEVTKKVADSLGFQLKYFPEPNWLTYERLLTMAELYRKKLAPLMPQDLIDVQSFFWVACGGYD